MTLLAKYLIAKYFYYLFIPLCVNLTLFTKRLITLLDKYLITLLAKYLITRITLHYYLIANFITLIGNLFILLAK